MILCSCIHKKSITESSKKFWNFLRKLSNIIHTYLVNKAIQSILIPGYEVFKQKTYFSRYILKLQFFITSLKTSKAGPDCLKLKAQFRILSRNGKILLHYAKISAFMSLKLTMVYVIQLRFAQTLICLYLYYRRYFVAIWFTPTLSFVGYYF